MNSDSIQKLPHMLYNDTALDRFWAKVQKGGEDECWPWTAGCTHGFYGWFVPNGRKSGLGAHKFSYFLANGEMPPDGQFVRHTCDNPPCVNPKHLVAGTPQQNVDDMFERKRNRSVLRDDSPMAKLTSADEEYIRNSRRSGKELAAEFGVVKSVISRIRNMTPERRAAENARKRAYKAKKRLEKKALETAAV